MIKKLRAGVRLSYNDTGDPGSEPLVLVTGAGGSKDGWGPLAELLSSRHRLISFDCRGLGESDAGEGPLSMEAVADDIAALLDTLGLTRAHVLGWSFGSAAAQTFAVRHPGRLGGLVLWSTWPRTDGYLRSVFSALRYPFVHGDIETAVTVLELVFSPELLDSPLLDEVIGQLRPLMPRTEQQIRTTVQQWDAALGHDLTGRLSSITAPTLVVAGDQDILCPPRMGRAVADLVPAARYELFHGPGSSHAVGLERVDEFGTLVCRFLADHCLAEPAMAGSE